MKAGGPAAAAAAPEKAPGALDYANIIGRVLRSRKSSVFPGKGRIIMRLIIQFLKPHWKLFAATVVLLTLDVMGGLFIPTLAAQMLNLGTAGAPFARLCRTGALMAAAALASGACAIGGGYLCAVLVSRVSRDIRVALYEKSLKLSIYDFRHFGTASITTRTVSDVNTIQMALTNTVQLILPVPIICVTALILCFRLDVQIGLVLLAVIGVLCLLAGGILYSAVPLFQKLQKLLDRMSQVFLENITGVRVIRAFNNEEREEQRTDEAFGDYAATSIKANLRFANLDALSFFFINIFIIAVYYMSGAKISVGALEIGDITAMIEYAILVMFFLMMAQMVILTLPRALECCGRIREILEHTPEILDQTEENPRERDVPAEAVLEFRDVSFRFADAQEDALSHLSFVCRRGETTAVIGGTGSGKSTIASLALRFHDVSEGQVLLNGIDIRKMPQAYLRDHLGYVQQKAWLFSGTIASNLRYGNEGASEEELLHALEVAQAGELIRSLPDGLQSYVAQGGANFSGGQKQRLSIARALVKRPELYIVDDGFSALDFKTDAALRKALAEETKDAAVLIIAQRVSTIRRASQIIVLHDGKMAGIGTHEELMAHCRVYREIYESQTKEAQEE